MNDSKSQLKSSPPKVFFCVVPNCNSLFLTGYKNNYTFHHFPKDPLKIKLWLNAIGLELVNIDDVKPGSSKYKICEKHFSEDNYVSNKKIRLKKDAVPNLNFNTVNAVNDKCNVNMDQITNGMY